MSPKEERNSTSVGTSRCCEASGDERSCSAVSLHITELHFGINFVSGLAVRGYFVRSPFDLRAQNVPILINRPHFLLVYQRNDPLAMFREHRKV